MALIFARKACEKERYQIIGFCRIYRKEGIFRTRISENVLHRSETNHYYIRIPRQFAQEHYMEELIVDSGKWKKSVRIERKIII